MIEGLQWFFLVYICLMFGGAMLLHLSAMSVLRAAMRDAGLQGSAGAINGLEPPVTVVVPVYNEQAGIVTLVEALMRLDYPDYEVIVVNDGSRDSTMDLLRRSFDLAPSPVITPPRLKTASVRNVLRSRRYPALVVLDKENGGKGDALNAGINGASHPLVCRIDADAVLRPDSLAWFVRPFLEDPATVASIGTMRVSNGSSFSGGFMAEPRAPRTPLALFQAVEYLRAGIFANLGWQPFNVVPSAPGAVAVFDKRTLIEIGGYRTDVAGSDQELVLRLHRKMRADGRHYSVVSVPAPVCWTAAPETIAALRDQRIRWHQGLGDSLAGHTGLVATPFRFVFEWLGPVIELLAYVFMIAGWAFGVVDTRVFLVFLGLALGLGMLVSLSAVALEASTFAPWGRRRDYALAAVAAVAENLGYRQAVAWWRSLGLARRWIRPT